jgi:hypothetical protein
MLEHIEAYCTVNEIEDTDLLMKAAQALLDHDDKELITFARKGYILQLFKQLVEEKLTLEQFINNGEQLDDDLAVVQHPQLAFHQLTWREAPYQLMQLLELDDMLGANTLFVVEKQVWDSFHHQQQLLGNLEERQSTLMVI